MAAVLLGPSPVRWSGEIDEEGYRTYEAVWQVKAATTDGPAIVLACPGIPTAGTGWAPFGSESDAFVYATKKRKAKRVKDDQGIERDWHVTQEFTNRPSGTCADTSTDNPLLQPQGISGGFVKYTREGIRDRFDNYIKSSSHEPLRGNQNEWDAHYPGVTIEQNVLDLELALFSQMVDTLNDAPLWGLPARCVKLDNVSWNRAYYGTCNKYYQRKFEFSIKYETFDRLILDEGTKVLSGKWRDGVDDTGADVGEWELVPIRGYTGSPNPDPNKPHHFIRFQDRKGNVARVVLDGRGRPANTTVIDWTRTDPLTNPGQPFALKVEFYRESNFLALGIPVTL